MTGRLGGDSYLRSCTRECYHVCKGVDPDIECDALNIQWYAEAIRQARELGISTLEMLKRENAC